MLLLLSPTPTGDAEGGAGRADRRLDDNAFLTDLDVSHLVVYVGGDVHDAGVVYDGSGHVIETVYGSVSSQVGALRLELLDLVLDKW